MGFLGIYRALYDYAPQAAGELALGEGDLLYVIEKNDDDGWWKAKKKAVAEDEDEPIGLIPNNYVQQAPSLNQARAIFEYTRQTDEELSFSEDALLDVFDTSDPDWILAAIDGEYGFVPSNYIDIQAASPAGDGSASPETPPRLPARPPSRSQATANLAEDTASPGEPAAAIAGLMQSRPVAPRIRPPADQPIEQSAPSDNGNDSDAEQARSPVLPSRPRPPSSAQHSNERISANAATPGHSISPDNGRTPGGFHLYNINEMVSVMGKRKKMPTTLGINLGTGTILIAPERAQDEPPQEWTADKMTHYSREGKHVFMELIRPSKSIDFHAGAKDTAEEIVAALGELAGAVRAEGLREVIMAGSRQRRGQILYDFMAQGEDEVTVAAGDDVIVLDDSKSDEWWQVRRLKNGKEGVVPSSYIEMSSTLPASPAAPAASPESGSMSARSTVEQNRREEIRLTKEAIKASKEPQQVGPGMSLPERGSSLMGTENHNNSGQQRSRRESGRPDGSSQLRTKAKPDSSKVRTWTDRSKSFSVEAQFLGLKDGKIHLHKMNGVKIAVPIAKMSREDLEYVEKSTGISLDDEKPLADVKRARSMDKRPVQAGVTVENKIEFDWFQFFLSCDVAVGLCERYAQAFIKDSMDESVLSDVDATILRTLGLREGDIIKVMRNLDTRFARDRGGKTAEGDGGSGGLFSGPRGALRNNTRKGRPAPAVQTGDVVDVSAFSKTDASDSVGNTAKSPPSESPVVSPGVGKGFDDDAWDVKPIKKEMLAEEVKPTINSVPLALTDSMKELSLLTAPLQPTKIEKQSQATDNTDSVPGQAAVLASDSNGLQPHPLPGASPSFFSAVSLAQQPTGANPSSHASHLSGQVSPSAMPRQRPVPNSTSPIQGSLGPPPSSRLLPSPQSMHQGLAGQAMGSVQSQVAPPGQSLNDIRQAQLQQQYVMQMQQQMQPAMTGYPGLQPQGVLSFPTGNPQFMQPLTTGTPMANAYTTTGTGHFPQPQTTGFNTPFPLPPPSYGHAPTAGINNYLPPALEPQRTGLPITQFQAGTNIGGYGQSLPPQPLLPQKTGPPPPVRFGVTGDANKLAPQQTGRRANLAQATPQNPFGF